MLFRLLPRRWRGVHRVGAWAFDTNLPRAGGRLGCGGVEYDARVRATYRWAARHVWWRLYHVYRREFIG